MLPRLALLLGLVVTANVARSQEPSLADELKGASIVAQDEDATFLGTIDGEFAKDSIFNEFSKYGSEFGPNSIFNTVGKFGSEFGRHSPFNEFCTKPPKIIKKGKVIGYLTANKTIRGGIPVSVIRSIKRDL